MDKSITVVLKTLCALFVAICFLLFCDCLERPTPPTTYVCIRPYSTALSLQGTTHMCHSLLLDQYFMRWTINELTSGFDGNWIYFLIFIGALADLAALPIAGTLTTLSIYQALKDRFVKQVQAQQILINQQLVAQAAHERNLRLDAERRIEEIQEVHVGEIRRRAERAERINDNTFQLFVQAAAGNLCVKKRRRGSSSDDQLKRVEQPPLRRIKPRVIPPHIFAIEVEPQKISPLRSTVRQTQPLREKSSSVGRKTPGRRNERSRQRRV